MKVGILAGGLGSRLSEETTIKPKPMVEIGENPILWHIMKYYAQFGHTDFAVALGYKGEYIKRWFADHVTLGGDLRIETGAGEVTASGPRKRRRLDDRSHRDRPQHQHGRADQATGPVPG